MINSSKHLKKRKTVYKNKKIVPAGSAIISEYANEIAGPKKLLLHIFQFL
jgi:hypothetical protein